MKWIVFLGILTLSIFRFLIAQPPNKETVIKTDIWEEVKIPCSYNHSSTSNISESIIKANGLTENINLSKSTIAITEKKKRVVTNLNQETKKGDINFLNNSKRATIFCSKSSITKETLNPVIPPFSSISKSLNPYDLKGK